MRKRRYTSSGRGGLQETAARDHGGSSDERRTLLHVGGIPDREHRGGQLGSEGPLQSPGLLVCSTGLSQDRLWDTLILRHATLHSLSSRNVALSHSCVRTV